MMTMNAVPVFYATTEGQTRRIAKRIATGLRAHGLDSAAIDVRSPEAISADWTRVAGVVLGASVHVGRHQRRAAEFVRRNRERLQSLPSAFFSVSLAAGSANPERVAEAERIALGFTTHTGWTPRRLACVAGRPAYTRYGFPRRWVTRSIAAREDARRDASADHEHTDWEAVDRLAAEVASDVREVLARAGRPTPELRDPARENTRREHARC